MDVWTKAIHVCFAHGPDWDEMTRAACRSRRLEHSGQVSHYNAEVGGTTANWHIISSWRHATRDRENQQPAPKHSTTCSTCRLSATHSQLEAVSSAFVITFAILQIFMKTHHQTRADFVYVQLCTQCLVHITQTIKHRRFIWNIICNVLSRNKLMYYICC
jgi:hypothetical protein